MSWVFQRSLAIGLSVIAAVISLGLVSSFGITSSTTIISSITYGHLVGAYAAYIAFILAKRYI